MFEVHPRAILKEELEARAMSANALALHIGSGRIVEILNEKRGISPDTALRRGYFFGNDPQFWLNLQSSYELAVARRRLGERIRHEVRPATNAA